MEITLLDKYTRKAQPRSPFQSCVQHKKAMDGLTKRESIIKHNVLIVAACDGCGSPHPFHPVSEPLTVDSSHGERLIMAQINGPMV